MTVLVLLACVGMVSTDVVHAQNFYNLCVELQPAEVNSIGAMWSATPSNEFYASGVTINLQEAPAAHYLSFTQVSGYYSPTNKVIYLTNHSNAPPAIYTYKAWSNLFYINPVYGNGSDAGSSISTASWSIACNNSTFTNPVSGTGAYGPSVCPTGRYELSWGTLSGWVTPPIIVTNITGPLTDSAAFTGVYNRVVARRITIDHNPADVTNAVWTLKQYPSDYDFYTTSLKGGTNSGIITNAPAGIYVVGWSQVDGWDTPADSTNTVDTTGDYEILSTYMTGARLRIHIYRTDETVDGVRLDGIGCGRVALSGAVGTFDGSESYYFTPGASATLTAVPTNCYPQGFPTPAHDSFFYEWSGDYFTDNNVEDMKSQNPITVTVGTPGMSNQTITINLLFSRECLTNDNVGDLDNDYLPDSWELAWSIDPKDATEDNGRYGNGDEDWIPSASTSVCMIVESDGRVFNFYGLDRSVAAYPLVRTRLLTKYNDEGNDFNNVLECRGLDGWYLTNGPLGAIASDDPLTNPNEADSDMDQMDDGWEYYFWRWRSKNAADRGLSGSSSNSWVLLNPNIWNERTLDADNDGVSDGNEYTYGTDPTQADTDFDGIDDAWESEEVMDFSFGSSNACSPFNQSDWNANGDNDYCAYCIVTNTGSAGSITNGQPGTVFGYRVCNVDGRYWADVRTNDLFDFFNDMILACTNTALTNGQAGTALAAGSVLYGSSANMSDYRQGDAIWVDSDSSGTYSANDAVIYDPPFKHITVYTMPPGTPGPGICSFDPRTAWDTIYEGADHPNTVAYDNYLEYRGGDNYGRRSWSGDGYAYAQNDNDLALTTNSWTAPNNQDSDSDLMPDGWELYVGLNPNSAEDAYLDPDEDGLPNIHEWSNTNNQELVSAAWLNKPWPTDPGVATAPAPNDPHPADTDWDGLMDGPGEGTASGGGSNTTVICELDMNSNPTCADSDRDLLPDGWEAYAGSLVNTNDWTADPDGDGLCNLEEYFTGMVDEWMLCDPDWGSMVVIEGVQVIMNTRFSVRNPMDWDEFSPYFLPPDFFTCPAFMYQNGVITDLDTLRATFPAASAGTTYHTTKASEPDSDGDGMDDYWEVFHGLNPLAGKWWLLEDVPEYSGQYVGYYDADPSTPGFQTGFLVGNSFIVPANLAQLVALVAAGTVTLDPSLIAGPVNFGLEGMDPDGDGLPNSDEYSYTEGMSVYHSDPTPYARTDRQNPYSFVRTCYNIYNEGWGRTTDGQDYEWRMFRFESAEGFDTDNDGISDYTEVTGSGSNAADPVNSRTPPRNRAIVLDGKEDFLRIVDGYYPVSPSFFRKFCVEAWIMPFDAEAEREQILVERAGLHMDAYSPGSTIVRANFRLGVNADGLPFIAYNSIGSMETFVTTARIGHKLQEGVWTHVAGSYDGEFLVIYVNGEISSSVRTLEVPATGNLSGGGGVNHTIMIGARDRNPGDSLTNASPYNHFGGYIDEVRIWDGDRTRDQIAANMERTYGWDDLETVGDLAAYYTFDDVPDPKREAVVPSGFGSLDTNLVFHPSIQWWSNAVNHSTVYTGSSKRPYNYLVLAEDHVFHKPLLPAWDDWTHMNDYETVVITNGGYVSTNMVVVGTNGIPSDYKNIMNPYYYYTAGYAELNQDLCFFRGAMAEALTNNWLTTIDDGVDMTDSDGDGLPDSWEVIHGLDPFSATGDNGTWGDPDGDGLNNRAEYMAGTNPRNSDSDGNGIDDYDSCGGPGQRTWGEMYTDGDGMSDVWESQYGLDPLAYDANLDKDGDGWCNYTEYMGGTDPSSESSYPKPSISGAVSYPDEYEDETLVVIAYQTNTMDGVPKVTMVVEQSGTEVTVDYELIGFRDGTKTFSGRLPNMDIPLGTEVRIVSSASGGWEAEYLFTETVTAGGTNYTYSGLGEDHGAEISYQTGEFTLTWADYAYGSRNWWEYSGYGVYASYQYELEDRYQYSASGFDEGPVYLAAFKDLNNNRQPDSGEPFGIAEDIPVYISYQGIVGPRIVMYEQSDIPWFPRFWWNTEDDTTDTDEDSVVTNQVRVSIRNIGASGVEMIGRVIKNPRNCFHEWDYMQSGYPFGLPTGNYMWRVADEYGYFSVGSYGNLSAPVLKSPRGDTLYYARNEMMWYMDTHATRYHLQVISPTRAYVDAYFPAPSPQSDGYRHDYFPNYANELGNGTYFWRMSAANAVYESEWSEWQSFSIDLSVGAGARQIDGDLYYFGKAGATNIVVEAFDNVSFGGEPNARITIAGACTTNAIKGAYTLLGLRPGRYYVRAYADISPAGGGRNGVLDSWEPVGFYRATVGADQRPSQIDISTVYRFGDGKITIRDRDTDNDNMPDGWEMSYFGTMEYTGDMDYDGDGVNNLTEYATERMDTDPTKWDTDGDGLSDRFEVFYDGFATYNPYDPTVNTTGGDLNPVLIDTDGDGFADGMELRLYHTNPLDPTSYPANPGAYGTGFGGSSDYDGDGRSDLGVFHQIAGNWYILTWDGAFYALPFGWSETEPLVGDYDGDGRTDLAVYHGAAGTWYIWTWAGGYATPQFGWAGAIPVPGDYSGDGRTDLGVFDPVSGTWHMLTWSGQYYTLQFGWAGVTPVTGDFDNDGRTDLAVFHPASGNWYILTWTGLYYTLQFGWAETEPVSGDFDGDGKTDLAVYHRAMGTWYILTWTGQYYQIPFGWSETSPVPGDYDGDFRTDLAVYHPLTGNWYIWTWTGQFYQLQFGWQSAAPIQKGR